MNTTPSGADVLKTERASFAAWIRTHEDEHGAVDEASAWAGWTGRVALSAAQDAPAVSAGDAVFAFASMLTSLPRVVPFGSAAWATPGAELASAFNAANGLSVSRDFPEGLAFPKIEGELLACVEKAAQAQEAAPAQGEPSEDANIGKAVNRAARDLPTGWEISIDLERHAGVVRLIDPDGEEAMIEGRGELFSEQINTAIETARAAQQKGGE